MPEAHALLSASSSKQWLHCPPSVRLHEGFPNESSVYAAEGTFAHEVCEYKVRKYLHERVKRPQSEEFYTEEIREGHLFPLYVEPGREMEIGKWLDAGIGERLDETHVKGRCGPLSLRPGFHSTKVPFADWIGKRGQDGRLYQRRDTVWCECEIEGREQAVTDRNGLRTLPSDWYCFRTNVRQPEPWIISNRILIRRILTHREVETICKAHGYEAQPMEGEAYGKQ